MTAASESVKLSPWFINRAWRTRHAWEAVEPYYQEWVVAVGHVTPRGLIVHGEIIPWPSRLHQRLWHQFQWGVPQAQMERLMMQNGVGPIVAEDPTWRRLSLNFLGVIDSTPFDKWADRAYSALAYIKWVPLFHRAHKNGRYGWAHPTIPALFIPDSDLLTPILQRIPWDTPANLGAWLHDAIRQWEQHDAPDAWFDQADETHLTTERLVGMQFAMWTAMGLGYFDATHPLHDWLSLWPPDPDWLQALKAEILGG